MTSKRKKLLPTWSDPDDAPDWTDEQIARAEIAHGDTIIRPAAGTLTRPRGRPKSESPKVSLSLRIDPAVLAHYRAFGPGWQAHMQAALREYLDRPVAKAARPAKTLGPTLAAEKTSSRVAASARPARAARRQTG